MMAAEKLLLPRSCTWSAREPSCEASPSLLHTSHYLSFKKETMKPKTEAQAKCLTMAAAVPSGVEPWAPTASEKGVCS